MTAKVINWINILVIACMFFLQAEGRASTMETHSITLTGTASGGVLTLVEMLNRNARDVSIVTKAGEPAESVANRLASAINELDPFKWWEGKVDKSEDDRVYTVGNSVRLPGPLGQYVFAGTEKGMGIPKPPMSLSCSYNPDKDQIVLHWVNPPGGYESIAIVRDGFAGSGHSGTLTGYVFDRKGRAISDMSFCVVGLCGGVPSNVAVVHLSKNSQDELFSIPFTDGVAPNWTRWSTSTDPNVTELRQATKSDVANRKVNIIRGPDDKPFFQMIRTKSPKVIAGVRRKFLGLTAGHTYRLSARLNTLEMDSCKTEWSFALHAACNAPGGGDLTTMQLAGAAALPDGSSGPAAGRIASYSPTATTKGKWVEHSTDITLPAGVDTITVWVRHSGADTTGVGIDWVKLENLSQ